MKLFLPIFKVNFPELVDIALPTEGVFVEMLAPQPNSRIYDPCCGSLVMFVLAEKFVETGSSTFSRATY